MYKLGPIPAFCFDNRVAVLMVWVLKLGIRDKGIVFSYPARRWPNGGLIMNNSDPLEFLKREGRAYSFPEPKHGQKDNSKFRLLVLGLLVCVLAAICHAQ